MAEEPEWPKSIIYWNKISDKSLQLALAQSETILKETVVTAQSIQDKTEKLISLLIPAITALLAYVLAHYKSITDTLVLSAVFTIYFIAIALYYLGLNFQPYKIQVPGEDAEIFINNQTIKNPDPDGYQYIRIGLQICKTYKERADKNEILNGTRSTRNKLALFVLVIGLPTSPILALLLHLLSTGYHF